MLERPNLPDQKIIECLRQGYGLSVTGFEFLPIGNDSATWVYRATGRDGQSYFVKLRKGKPYEPGVTIPRYLKDSGMAQIIEPLPTQTGALWHNLDGFTLFLYPYINGRSGMDSGLTDAQWVEYGAAVRHIHTTTLPAALAQQLPQETFAPHPRWTGVVRRLQAEIHHQEYDSPAEKELAAFWRARHEEIGRILARTEELGRQLQQRPAPFVLCHADIHVANLLLDQTGRLYVIDWDQPMLAPKERDLVYILDAAIGQVVTGPREEALFFQGYRNTDVDPLALTYYRYDWVVQDLGSYAEQALFNPEVSEASKQDAAEGLFVLFRPGSSVEGACRSEGILRP
jgi:spectinomycin phosphotransferase